jgi:hypothetical protein
MVLARRYVQSDYEHVVLNLPTPLQKRSQYYFCSIELCGIKQLSLGLITCKMWGEELGREEGNDAML